MAEFENAFLDDRLTLCYQKQEAALNSLRKVYGDGYGKPKKGSMSEIRGQKYQQSVNEEVVDLCRVISSRGKKYKNGTSSILFGDLFNVYQKISNKVVGVLHRARKNRLVHFDGETLWQGENDETNVTLLRNIRDIEEHYNKTGELLYNSDANNIFVFRQGDKGVNTICVKINYGEEKDLDFDTCEVIPAPALPVVEDTDFLVEETTEYFQAEMTPLRVEEFQPKPRKPQPVIDIRVSGGIKPRSDRVVLDFGSDNLVSSAVI
ncbi:uncharacterized protein LOC111702568 [Eurytemora carolleeae]|uniref:uncharacterized protein LOC111702568 n=1 Tax=Eurytemora carolleeae TaxID=1294199 RepID=UPI000C769D52|nr:uncharacterized protein LOC111702568 [Eurytemora carolleeae]|eukprot:XP_023330074.1 uncharacterized protein LOC111702568 [Eurytemora affinis]